MSVRESWYSPSSLPYLILWMDKKLVEPWFAKCKDTLEMLLNVPPTIIGVLRLIINLTN